ncbi:MAG: hypothetical protein OXJ55_18635 [Caldilineaceae bacterium]|nr:hypothetical protein [Caldilineaceae bacterium]MDE0463787.1 hypothetical protein [Caldilineaceae bacterium]
MSCNEQDRKKYLEESESAWDHRLQATFIVCNLKFGLGMEVTKDDLREAYLAWVGKAGQDWYPPAIGAFYESVTRMGAEPDPPSKRNDVEWNDVKKFNGVGLQVMG